MALKTYLQLVNLAEGYLRNTASAALTTTQDTVILAAYINAAKQKIENEWKWHVLRSTITFNSVADTASYDTSSLSVVSSDPTVTTERSELLFDPDTERPLFFDVTSGGEFQLYHCTREYAMGQRRLDSAQNVTSPDRVAVYHSGTGLTVLFPWATTGIRNYSFEVYTPSADLSASSDTLAIPHSPVVLTATAMLLEERGDEFGLGSQRFWDLAEEALQTEIAKDQVLSDLVLKVV